MNPGEILDNRYQILERLGAGGMGEVYKATHTHLGAPRVIKVVHPHISGSTDAQDRFMREARAATKVHHQNVATLHDFSTLPDGSHYMVWEFIDGENLAQKLRARGTLPSKQAVRLVIQALQGLEAIHRAGIVHRDISPENLMITHHDDGGPETVKIIDLGVAKIEDSEVSQTRTGIFVGKLRYAAPEQLGFIPEGEKIDARADVYSVGMVLVELLTGRPPYEAKSPHEYFILHASQAPPKPVELPAHLPGGAALQQVLDKALARDRNQRYATARDFAQALEEIERTLPDPREMATMALPLDGDETMRVKSGVDTLHRSTVITGAQTAPRETPPTAAPTILTPLPEQSFPQQPPKQGSLAPLIIIIALVLLAVGAVGLALKWSLFGEKKPESPIAETATTTAVATATTQPAKVAETSVDVTTATTQPPVTTTTAPPVLSAPTPTIVETATTATVAPTPRPTPPHKVEVVETPKPAPKPAEDEAPAEESEPPRTFGGVATYVDGGDDSDANERALDQLRRQLRGTRVVAIRAPGMQLELARALREQFPNLVFEGEADVVIRFNGTMERLGRGRKRRGATATISKGGRVIFRYEMPAEVYRVGMSPPDAFARVLANALEED